MNFDLNDAQRDWRGEVRSFLDGNLTPAVRAEMAELRGDPGPVQGRFHQAVIERSWHGIRWPKEYGGLEMSAVEELILIDEFQYAGAPPLPIGVTIVGPSIIRFGSETDRRRWLPAVTSGAISFALGYTEPDAGTDLASLQTTAVLDGNEWIVNGVKAWNRFAHVATHAWLAVRTDAAAPRHRGISILIVAMDSPGVRLRPVDTWGGVRVSEVIFDDVRVPAENLLGNVNEGWRYILGALDIERMAIAATGELRRLFDDLVAYCQQPGRAGTRRFDAERVRYRLAELAVDLDVARLLSYELAALVDRGDVPTVEASMGKVFLTELRARLADVGMSVAGVDGGLGAGDSDAPLNGRLENTYRRAPYHRFGAGANEIQRDIIAQRGFGLPRR